MPDRPTPDAEHQPLDLGIHQVERLGHAVIGLSRQVLPADLVKRLLGQAGVGDGGGLEHRRGQHVIAEEPAQQRGHLGLRAILGLVAGDEIAVEIEGELAAGVTHDAQQIVRHQQELAHRGDVEHLRMHRDDDAGRRAERCQRQES